MENIKKCPHCGSELVTEWVDIFGEDGYTVIGHGAFVNCPLTDDEECDYEGYTYFVE